jgi:hypothetical protein
MAMTTPDFLKVGAVVKVQHWYSEIIDVAVSDSRLMVLVKSPKGIWRNHPAEWLEFDEQQIIPASLDEAIKRATGKKFRNGEVKMKSICNWQ